MRTKATYHISVSSSAKRRVGDKIFLVLLLFYFFLQSSTVVKDSLSMCTIGYIHVEDDHSKGNFYILDRASVSRFETSLNVHLVYMKEIAKGHKSIVRKEICDRFSKLLFSKKFTKIIITEPVLSPSENNDVFIVKILQEVAIVFSVISLLENLSTVVFFERAKSMVLKNIKICFLLLNTFYNPKMSTCSNFSRPPPKSLKILKTT